MGWEGRFLAALAERGIVTRAVQAAGVARSTAYARREEDEEFARAWDEALEVAADVAEDELWRRSVVGVEKPVFYKGEEVASIREYSDRGLELLLKARRPEKFRENVRHEHGGTVGVRLDELIRQAEQE